MKTKNMTTLPIRNSINRSPLRCAFLLIPLVLVCSGLSTTAQAVNPAPDGAYGGANTAEGNQALFSLSTGSNNTALGSAALFSVTTGVQNTATGAQALHLNTGNRNTADGFQALVKTTSGNDNTAIGWRALFQNTMGVFNTAIGSQALYNNATGGGNVAVGDGAGFNITTGGNNIDIDNEGTASDNQTIRIGNIQSATFIAGIANNTITTNNAPVAIDTATFQLGLMPVTSSRRFKEDIAPMEKTSEAILRLKPVTFHYKKEIDPNGTVQFGLVAEEVEKVNPALVTRDRDGKPYTVRYEAVNAMLLNEFLKEHHQVQDLKAIVAEQQKQIKALAVGLQKVSTQVELKTATPQTVLNNQ